MKEDKITIRVPANVKAYLQVIAKEKNQCVSQILRHALVMEINSFREDTNYLYDQVAGLEA
jgi:predicted transcriptional regulator